jgi:pyrroline-5-carboxylate reductase
MAQLVLDTDAMRSALHDKLVISICAGVCIWQFKSWLPTTGTSPFMVLMGAIIRAMPNTPCKIRHGMTILATAATQSRVSAVHRERALYIFSVLGRVRFLEEKHMDAVTGLSGSGPAFAWYVTSLLCDGSVVLEALADGGVMMGLPRDVAIELSATALYGTFIVSMVECRCGTNGFDERATSFRHQRRRYDSRRYAFYC